ncbi:D-ribose pyranase [Planctomycetes bacterium MalM25]|nr:D-ribose pyranase [Planctomycetes bacterium MalM25]
MIKTGLLNPAIASLLRRTRHTNRLVIADRGFPYWPELETIDLSVVDDLPTVPQLLQAILPNFQAGHAWMAQEFLDNNDQATQDAFTAAFDGLSVRHEPHDDFKKLVPGSIGLIRTGETVQYANVILESA